MGKTKRGKGTKIMGIADGHGLPLALRTESASPAEVKLVSATLEERIVADVPERLIGDKAYDSDRLDAELMHHYGAEMIAPNKSNRRVPGLYTYQTHRTADVQGQWLECPHEYNEKRSGRIDFDTIVASLQRRGESAGTSGVASLA